MFSIKRRGQIIPVLKNEDGSCNLYKRDKIIYNCFECGKSSEILAQGILRYGYHFNNFPEDLHLLCRNCFIKKTNLEKYGVENVSQIQVVKEKKKQTCLDNHGVEYPVQSKEIQEKTKETNLEKYGVENVSQSEAIKEKTKKTNLERYGVENVSQIQEVKEKKKETCLKNFGVDFPFQSEKIREKSRLTNLEKYGFEYPIQSNEVQEKSKLTSLGKYGFEYPSQSQEVQEKSRLTSLRKYGFEHSCQNEELKNIISTAIKENYQNGELQDKLVLNNLELLDTYDGQRKPSFKFTTSYQRYAVKCKKCGEEFDTIIRSDFIKKCPACFPSFYSIPEDELVDFISSLGVEFIRNDRTIISPLELDIVIPEKKLAIEFNGLYWHSFKSGKDKNYHLNKTIQCASVGYSLIHIFEDEWKNKKEIVKSIIKSRLGIYNERVFARKCEIKEVDSKEATIFYNINHLQGGINSSVNIGLFYKNKLVSCLSFAEPRYNKNYDWEITRFANSLNISVVGGFSRLLKHFTKSYKGSIITYSDRRLFSGSVYRNNGFTELEPSIPSYFYLKNRERFSRVKFQKHKLKNLLESFDKELTEKQNMEANGWNWIYDCGNWVFEYKSIVGGRLMAKEKGTDYREILFFLSDKEKDYIRYINEHIANVKNVWKRVRLVNYPNGTEDTLVRLVNKAIEEHDSSKYVGNEFTGYRQWFYPEEGSKKDQKLFEKVWNEHQKANSYHWQYHLLFQPDMTTKALYMATVDVLEMLADWSAMSIKFDNVPSEWYEKNKDNMLLHPSTKNMIETFLPMFDEAIDLIQRGVDEPEEVKPEELVKKKRKPRAKKTETVESEEETVAEKEKPKKKAPAKKKAVAKKKEK